MKMKLLLLAGILAIAILLIAAEKNRWAAEDANSQTPAPRIADRTPKYDWQILEDTTFDLRPAEQRAYAVSANHLGAHVEASSGVDLRFDSRSRAGVCEFPGTVSAREQCIVESSEGEVHVIDSRTQNAAAVTGIAALWTHSSAMAERTIAPNRVHLILSKYVCTANCPLPAK